MKRKLLSIVLALTMALGMLPAAALAEGTEAKTGDLSYSENGAIVSGFTYTNGTMTVTGDNVTVENVTFGDGANLAVNTSGNFTLRNCTFNGKTDVRTPVTLNVGSATVTGNTFNGTKTDGTPTYYNAIEFAVSSGNKLSSATLSNNIFEAAIKNNYFSTYYYADNAVITAENNVIKLANRGSNAIRISNVTNSNVTFNLNNNSYEFSDASGSSEYEGFIILQDFSTGSAVQDFSKVTLNIKGLTAPDDAAQLFYVYDNHQNSIISTNQPVVKGDSSIEKFFVAKVGETYYTTLAEAINAAGNGDTVTLLKDAELTSTLDLAENITIDGQGKYTIKAANSFTVGSDNKTYCVLYVSGEVTLKDVTVNGNEKCRVIFCDKGKLTIDGATITNGKAPNFIGGVYMTSSASFKMKSGSITGNKNAELYQKDKYLQYSSDLWIGANANGALTAINGGTIGNVFVNANAWSANNPGSFTMNGGTVTNLYVEYDANYGATFKYDDGTIEHLYLSKENGNGQSIEVTPVKGVTYNGGVKEADFVTLTLKYNDGATADITYNVASGTTITLPTPKRSGYTFNGW